MIVLRLADFAFTGMEIPGHISLSSNQRNVAHDLPGGARVVDALGVTHDPITWGGMFLGADAGSKGKYLKHLQALGKPVKLQWSDYSFTVLINNVTCDFEKAYKIPYSITCVVVEDLSSTVSVMWTVDINQALQDDMGTVADNTIDVPGIDIKTPVSKLKSAIAGLRSAIKATQAQIKAAKDAIQDVQKQVTDAIASVNNTLQDITTLGGVLPANPVSTNVANIMQGVKHTNNMFQLMNLKYTVTRMDKNVTALLSGNARSVLTREVVSNTSLFKLAARHYGDATKWDIIARANGLKSPYITDSMTIIIPNI